MYHKVERNEVSTSLRCESSSNPCTSERSPCCSMCVNFINQYSRMGKSSTAHISFKTTRDREFSQKIKQYYFVPLSSTVNPTVTTV